ncbi:drebrin-like protein [Acipenser oxyrinchus oxyrinchus]|uniref:Drebrin-like protein n=1 Tax=Acipenser oxyrinchus oxyrinchus TaxID=40147 RepID=A0AAD8LWE1_ACIOX|nr:drebrin-like protein [Acipenser oxyrinchus oxyrinchus]
MPCVSIPSVTRRCCCFIIAYLTRAILKCVFCVLELDTTSKVATDCRGEEEFKIERIYKVEIASKEQAERPAEVYPEARPSPVHTHPVLTTETDLGVESQPKPGRDAGVENAPSEAAELEPELPTSSETAAGTETCLVLETQREAVPRTENGFKWGCEAPAACEAASIEAETESTAGEPFALAEDVLRSEEKETDPEEQSEKEAVAACFVGTASPLQLSSTEEDVLWSKEKETHPAEQPEWEAVAAGIVGTASPLQLSSTEGDVLWSEEKETHPAEQPEREAVAAGIVGTVSPLQLSSTEGDVIWSEGKETHPAEQSERVAAGIVGTVSPLQLSSTEGDVIWSEGKETHPAEQSEREAVAACIVGTVSPLQLSSTEGDVIWSEGKETHPAEQSEREAVAACIVGTVSPLQLSSTDKDGMTETEEEEAQKELTSEMSLVEEDDGETEEEEGERESSVEHNGLAELNHQTEEHSPQNAPKQVSVSAHCRAVHAGTEVDHTTKEQEERSERVNGKEHPKEPEREMSVQALCHYQAENDTELSFEPGDIISAVEVVDQGSWRGCSEDGRQGLFPSSHVETL